MWTTQVCYEPLQKLESHGWSHGLEISTVSILGVPSQSQESCVPRMTGTAAWIWATSVFLSGLLRTILSSEPFGTQASCPLAQNNDKMSCGIEKGATSGFHECHPWGEGPAAGRLALSAPPSTPRAYWRCQVGQGQRSSLTWWSTCPSWPQTTILPISASQVVGIIGMSPQCPVYYTLLKKDHKKRSFKRS
jgi:hypothetical protein